MNIEKDIIDPIEGALQRRIDEALKSVEDTLLPGINASIKTAITEAVSEAAPVITAAISQAFDRVDAISKRWESIAMKFEALAERLDGAKLSLGAGVMWPPVSTPSVVTAPTNPIK